MSAIYARPARPFFKPRELDTGDGTVWHVEAEWEDGTIDIRIIRGALVAQSPAPGKLSNWVAGTITGGTGKLVGIQGVFRSSGTAEPKEGINETQTDIDYWFEK